MSNSRQRNPIAGRWVALFLVFMSILPSSSMVGRVSSSDASAAEPLIAYKARVIPKIDGVVSPNEWDDAKLYSYEWEIGNKTFHVYLCLKHDEAALYILFIIDDNDVNNEDSLLICPGIVYSIEGDWAWDLIIVYSNGIYEGGYITRSGIWPLTGAPKLKGMNASTTYINGIYTFEVSCDLRYLNITSNNTAPLNIGYIDFHPEETELWEQQWIAYLGDWGTTEPGIVISSEYTHSSELGSVKPSEPMNLTATLNESKVKLTWEQPYIENATIITSNIIRYMIYRGTSEDSLELIASVNGSAYEYLDDNVTKGEKYYYAVSALNPLGEGNISDVVNVTIPQPPSPPMNLTATLSDSKVKLRWYWYPALSDGNATITEYKIYRGSSENSLELIASVNGSVYEYLDNNVTKGEKYYYAVSAVNPLGEGNMSEIVSIEIPKEKEQVPSIGFVGMIGVIAIVMWMSYRKKMRNR